MLPIFLDTCIQSPPLTALHLSSLPFLVSSSPHQYTLSWFSFYAASVHLSFLRCSDLPEYLSVSFHFSKQYYVIGKSKITMPYSVDIDIGFDVHSWRSPLQLLQKLLVITCHRDGCLSWSLSFPLSLLCSYLCCSFDVCFFDYFNVLLLNATCPKGIQNCSMLDEIRGLFIVNKSHVKRNAVLRGLFEYLSESM